jgi:hypothetical protein
MAQADVSLCSANAERPQGRDWELMRRSQARLSKVLATLSAFGVVGALSLSASNAAAQEVFPPAEYIATAEPVYYEGHPAYWYGGRWYYRNGGVWGHYDAEPAYLRDWRGRPGWGARYHYGNGGFRGGAFHGGRR